MTDEYEPHFDRLGVQRRVLGNITDEEHAGLGPRNTPEVLTASLGDDPYTAFDAETDDVQEYLDDLEASGLVAKRDDGSYEVTDAGFTELTS